MFKKGQIIICKTNNNFFGCVVGRECTVIKEFYYNGENWLKLVDNKTNETFNSPSILW